MASPSEGRRKEGSTTGNSEKPSEPTLQQWSRIVEAIPQGAPITGLVFALGWFSTQWTLGLLRVGGIQPMPETSLTSGLCLLGISLPALLIFHNAVSVSKDAYSESELRKLRSRWIQLVKTYPVVFSLMYFSLNPSLYNDAESIINWWQLVRNGVVLAPLLLACTLVITLASDKAKFFAKQHVFKGAGLLCALVLAVGYAVLYVPYSFPAISGIQLHNVKMTISKDSWDTGARTLLFVDKESVIHASTRLRKDMARTFWVDLRHGYDVQRRWKLDGLILIRE